MADLVIPDVSEYQTVDFDRWSGPIIVRAHNSNRPDNKWAQHAAGAARQPWWGAYQYLTAGADPAAAARALLATLGDRRPNCTMLDLEEGAGDQRARQHAWLDVMAGDPAVDWTYSGLYFTRAHNLDDVQWIAAYGQREPTDAHRLWQFSSGYTFPGISSPTDASVFHGTVDDLLALTEGDDDMLSKDEIKAAVREVLDEGTLFGVTNPDGSPGAGVATFHFIAERVRSIDDKLNTEALAASIAAKLPAGSVSAAVVEEAVKQALREGVG